MSAALPWRWLGRVAHDDGIAIQEAVRARLLAGDTGAACVLLCEHEPVITLGRNADRENVLADPVALERAGVTVVQTKRGGDVTYHGPGQLMVYPALRVRGSVADFLALIAAQLAEVAARYGVVGAYWQRQPAGLWLRQGGDADRDGPAAKLAACGLHLRRRAVLHGFALNVATPAAQWALIRPCGLTAPVTSLAAECERAGLPPPPPVAEVAERAAPLLCHALSVCR